MRLHFYKYQGTGNDFVLVDNRKTDLKTLSAKTVKQICDRRFGVGADGLILLENLPGYDFKMVYYNSDGRESTMCGNGGRCIVRFAADLGIVKDIYEFKAVDGDHLAEITDNGVSLQMINVEQILSRGNDLYMNTGSPHHLVFSGPVKDINIPEQARAIRYSSLYNKEGVNVNYVHVLDEKSIEMRTYERGVEDETLSCGTGVTAAAIAAFYLKKVRSDTVKVYTPGGELTVRFRHGNDGFEDIWLTGPATFVFEGEIEI